MKKIISLILITIISFSLYSQEDNVFKEKVKKSKELGYNIADSVQINYNYLKNKKGYKITFLEFGMTTCIPCRKMKKVMHEIDSLYKGKVNVIFHNVVKEPAKTYADYYEIELIPVQILLNEEGKIFYRHEGYIPTETLSIIIDEQLNR